MARKRNNTGRARKGTGSIRQKQNKRKNGTVTESYEIRFSLGSGADRVQKSESYSLKSEAEARLLLIESIIAAGKSAHKSIEEICAELSRSVESNDDVEMIAAESETSADFSTATKSFFDDWTLDEWFDYWVTNFVVGGAESTPRKYRNDYRLYISPHIGSKKLREILPVDIQLMVNKWRDPQYKIKKILSKKYVKDIHSFLKTCFKQAKENNLIAKNPCSKTVLPKITKADKILIKFKCSIKEVGKILAVLRDAPHDRLYKFAIGFGLRILENLALTMQDIDMVNHVIHLRFQLRKDLSEKIHYDDGESLHFRTLKDADPRDIVFDDEIAAILQAQIDSETAKKKRLGDRWPVEELERGDLLFSNDQGSYLSYSTVRDCFYRRARTIIPDICLHDLRHIYIMLAYWSGVPLEVTANHVGHGDEKLTREIYLSIPDEMEIKSAADVGNTIKQLLAAAENKSLENLIEDKR